MPDIKYTVINPGSPEPMPLGGILKSSFRVGYRFRCTMTMDVSSLAAGPAIGVLHAQWEPSLPHQLSAAEWRDYRAGRDALFRRAASILGRRVGVGELAEDASTSDRRTAISDPREMTREEIGAAGDEVATGPADRRWASNRYPPAVQSQLQQYQSETPP